MSGGCVDVHRLIYKDFVYLTFFIAFVQRYQKIQGTHYFFCNIKLFQK